MALFIASESVFFLSVVAVYASLRAGSLDAAKHELDVARTAVFSLFLFASSATMTIAERRGGPAGLRWLVLTALLGVAFLTGQVVEYARLFGSGIGPSTGLFGTTFFTLTGLHALHVLAGLFAIAVLAVAAARRGSAVRPTAWEAVAWYWHFVDGVWVVVFSVVYLGTLLA
jgi:heme/copper-type cytochrome/quinol oxidase subunit 3